jgi:hypothetical protein
MTPSIDHATCSARLGAYLAGRLGPSEAAEVERHLQVCRDCGDERRALAILQGLEVDPLTDSERARLHAAVEAAVAARPGAASLDQRLRWRARLAPALAAAAVFVVLAVGAAYVFTAGGQGAQVGAGGEAGGAQDAGSSAGGRAGRKAAAPRQAAKESDQAAPGGRAALESRFALVPRFDPSVGSLSPVRLRRIGRRSPVFRAAADTYTVRDADRLGDDFVSRLAEQAPPEVAAQLQSCAASVDAVRPRALAVYAAVGRLENRKTLVVGFIRPERGSNRLNGYEIRAWRQGSCDAILELQEGPVSP